MWVSEVMLQQTQVATVIDYYTRWMQVMPGKERGVRARFQMLPALWKLTLISSFLCLASGL